MNEIEYAITNFEEFLEADIGQGDLHMCSAEIALAALREKAEREKGCEYCKPRCHNCKHDVYDGFCRYYGKHGCGNLHHEPKYNYCPMCGKRLEVEHE
jgi:hypothetical protein